MSICLAILKHAFNIATDLKIRLGFLANVAALLKTRFGHLIPYRDQNKTRLDISSHVGGVIENEAWPSNTW